MIIRPKEYIVPHLGTKPGSLVDCRLKHPHKLTEEVRIEDCLIKVEKTDDSLCGSTVQMEGITVY